MARAPEGLSEETVNDLSGDLRNLSEEMRDGTLTNEVADTISKFAMGDETGNVPDAIRDAMSQKEGDN